MNSKKRITDLYDAIYHVTIPVDFYFNKDGGYDGIGIDLTDTDDPVRLDNMAIFPFYGTPIFLDNNLVSIIEYFEEFGDCLE